MFSTFLKKCIVEGHMLWEQRKSYLKNRPSEWNIINSLNVGWKLSVSPTICWQYHVDEISLMLQLNHLRMNYSKTKIMTSENARILIDGVTIGRVDKYNYQGHIIILGKENRAIEGNRWIQLSWVAFGKLAH